MIWMAILDDLKITGTRTNVLSGCGLGLLCSILAFKLEEISGASPKKPTEHCRLHEIMTTSAFGNPHVTCANGHYLSVKLPAFRIIPGFVLSGSHWVDQLGWTHPNCIRSGDDGWWWWPKPLEPCNHMASVPEHLARVMWFSAQQLERQCPLSVIFRKVYQFCRHISWHLFGIAIIINLALDHSYYYQLSLCSEYPFDNPILASPSFLVICADNCGTINQVFLD